MIRIERSLTTNTFAVTLKENTTLANPFYLFVFVNDITNSVYSIVLLDTSEHKERYNRFTISSSFFPSDGWYSYKAYQQDDYQNLDIQLTNGVVEEGRLFVAEVSPEVYTYTTNPTHFKEY